MLYRCVKDFSAEIRLGALKETVVSSTPMPGNRTDDTDPVLKGTISLRILKLPCTINGRWYDSSNISSAAVEESPQRILMDGQIVTAPDQCILGAGISQSEAVSEMAEQIFD
jgi:hypothetical protein